MSTWNTRNIDVRMTLETTKIISNIIFKILERIAPKYYYIVLLVRY